MIHTDGSYTAKRRIARIHVVESRVVEVRPAEFHVLDFLVAYTRIDHTHVSADRFHSIGHSWKQRRQYFDAFLDIVSFLFVAKGP